MKTYSTHQHNGRPVYQPVEDIRSLTRRAEAAGEFVRPRAVITCGHCKYGQHLPGEPCPICSNRERIAGDLAEIAADKNASAEDREEAEEVLHSLKTRPDAFNFEPDIEAGPMPEFLSRAIARAS